MHTFNVYYIDNSNGAKWYRPIEATNIESAKNLFLSKFKPFQMTVTKVEKK